MSTRPAPVQQARVQDGSDAGRYGAVDGSSYLRRAAFACRWCGRCWTGPARPAWDGHDSGRGQAVAGAAPPPAQPPATSRNNGPTAAETVPGHPGARSVESLHRRCEQARRATWMGWKGVVIAESLRASPRHRPGELDFLTDDSVGTLQVVATKGAPSRPARVPARCAGRSTVSLCEITRSCSRLIATSSGPPAPATIRGPGGRARRRRPCWPACGRSPPRSGCAARSRA